MTTKSGEDVVCAGVVELARAWIKKYRESKVLFDGRRMKQWALCLSAVTKHLIGADVKLVVRCSVAVDAGAFGL